MENQNETKQATITTVRELYEWAKQNDMLDAPIGLQYQNEDGTYNGDTYAYNYGYVETYVSKQIYFVVTNSD